MSEVKAMSAIDIMELAKRANNNYWRSANDPLERNHLPITEQYANVFGPVIFALQDRIADLEQQLADEKAYRKDCVGEAMK